VRSLFNALAAVSALLASAGIGVVIGIGKSPVVCIGNNGPITICDVSAGRMGLALLILAMLVVLLLVVALIQWLLRR